MDIDPYYNIEESGIAGKHHILVVPDQILTTAAMNIQPSTGSVITGSVYYDTGYYGSDMLNKTLPSIDTTLSATVFGDHLLSYNEIVSTDNSTGTTTASVKSIIMNEMEVLGYTTNSVASSGLLDYQLSGFKQNSDLIIAYKTSGSSTSYWVRDCCMVTTNPARRAYCCIITSSGNSDTWHPGNSTGVRPRFLLG
jgi:hypothetical protein